MNKVKIVVHVPPEAANVVRAAVGDAGAGVIGNYARCSFTFSGTGRFTPNKGAQPNIGEIGKSEVITEECIEVVCDRADAKQVLAALRAAHPYEEPAYEVYELIDEDSL